MDRPGFATGFLTGLGLGTGFLLVLALAFPPFVLSPPELDAATGTPPPALLRPAPDTGMGPPRLPGPLVALPAGAPPPSGGTLSGLAPQVAPDVFGGNPAGSPSLVPAD